MRKISFFANIAIELTLDVCKILLGKIEAMTSASNENKEKDEVVR
jgi:16S rRNA G527 N7-methylase RsmG